MDAERAARRDYLAKLNTVVDLARTILAEGRWTYDTAWIEEERDNLAALGRITTLPQAAKVEKIGWSLGDIPQGGHAGTIGDALVSVGETYFSRFPIDDRAMQRADETIEELRSLLAPSASHGGDR